MGIVTNAEHTEGKHCRNAPHRGVGAMAFAGCHAEASSQHEHFLPAVWLMIAINFTITY